MDVKGCAAVLLFLGLMAIPVHNASSNSLCSILNETLSNKTSNFTLLVNPDNIFLVNHTYTVTLSGKGNVTVIFQALPSSNISGSVVGQWSNTTENCDGSPLFQNLNENGSVSANWTSPNTVQSVVIYAYFKEGNDLFRKEVQLDVVSPANTTKAPDTTENTTLTTGKPGATAPDTTENTTLTTGKPSATASQITTTTLVKTTSASSVIHPSSLIMALTEAIGLFFITSKFLS
ncbi:placenta-expressed transcript 1 protein [Xenopus laevis]|uniref:Placenta-expressed transcript 1 protein n=2 Tax=Xenopus laevis TaxID=8355 RepID=A0A974HA71_XENLA|nr:placenta-expressed transcript 1 protein [Xenopus laevis]OCT70533.1 hypothetical protein XELAEV_18037456mg [Xenopus laevis]